MRSGIGFVVASAAALLLHVPAFGQDLPAPPTAEQVRASRSHAQSTHPMSIVRQIVVHQEQFRNRNGRYAETFAELGYGPPEGVNGTLTRPNNASYSTVVRTGEMECAAYVGEVEPPRPYVERPSAVRCNAAAQPAQSHRH